MTKSVIFSFLMCIVCSCSSKTNSDAETNQADTLVSSEVELSPDTMNVVKEELSSTVDEQKVLFVNSDYYHYQIKATEPIVNVKKYYLGRFTRLKQGQDQFQYFVLADIDFSDKYKTKLIAEYYDSEEACWLVNYTLQGEFIDALEVFYDNAEGAWQNNARIYPKAGKVVLYSYDVYQIPENTTDTIKVLEDGFFPSLNQN